MIVDSSALLAILLDEPEGSRMSRAILSDASPSISAATLLETSMVFEARVGDRGAKEIDDLVANFGLSPVAFTIEQLAVARGAFRRFGRGRHPARLNFGDCIA